ncbi:unnamed protein product [Peniophora sp. CBMAI 1063]|nr:unnamed protein product [Peniophora sp. CBMAI 1063]
MTEPGRRDLTQGPWYCDWNWCRIKFTDPNELGKHVMEHIDDDYTAGLLACRKSDADRLRRTLEGLDSVSLNLQDSQPQSQSQSVKDGAVNRPAGNRSTTGLIAAPLRARSRSRDDSDEEGRPHKRMRPSFADVDAGSSPDAEIASLPDSPDIFAQPPDSNLKHLPPSPSPAAVDLTASPGPYKSKRPWLLPGLTSSIPEPRPSTTQERLSKEVNSLSHEQPIVPADPLLIGSHTQPQSHGDNGYGEWMDDIMSQAPFYHV